MSSSKILRYGVDNYVLKINPGGTVLIDAVVDGNGSPGNVIINANLQVLGTTTTIDSVNLEIIDNIIVLNKGEQGDGVAAGYAGVLIDRGTAPDVGMFYSEPDNAFVFARSQPDGEAPSTNEIGIQTNAINTYGNNLNFLNNSPANARLTVFQTENYERRIFSYTNGEITFDPLQPDKISRSEPYDDDLIPNIKAVTDYVSAYLTRNYQDQINSPISGTFTDGFSSVELFATNAGDLQSRIEFKVNSTTPIATITDTQADIFNVRLIGNTVTSAVTDGDLIVEANGTGLVLISSNTTISGDLTVEGEILDPNFEINTPYTPDLLDEDYFILKDVSSNETVRLTFGDLQNEISRTMAKSTKLYVDSSVDISGNGSYYKPYKTLEEAFGVMQTSPDPIAISVLPGTYYTNGNLALSDDCSIVSTNGQYATKIIMFEGFEEENCFLVGSGCYVQGFAFQNQRVDNLADPSSGFAIAFRPGARILRSPYIRDCSQISNYTRQTIAAPLDPVNANPLVGNGGGVILADRAILDQNSLFPYILAFGATPRSPNGIGYVAKNGAGINGISSISIFQRTAFFALNGGQITLNNSGTQFGDVSMRARGSTQVVDPYETTATLVQNLTLSNTIFADSETIIDNMWNYLVSEQYDFADEAKTRRDAGFLLRSVTYDLLSGQQTGTRNFIAGFFDYKADRVFTPTTEYDYEKCYRDTKLITEAIAYDVVFGSNFRTIKAALAYYRASASDVLSAPQQQLTLDAIAEHQSVLVALLTDPDSITRANTLYSIFLNIFTNGPVFAPVFDLINPVGYDSGFFEAKRLLLDNRQFILDEIDAWIASQIANDTPPFSTEFTYDVAACRRDVDFIIDALSYDLTYGGNLETFNAAISYFVGTETQFGEGESLVTIATYNYLQEILGSILGATSITPSAGNVTVQNVSGPAGSAEAITFAQARIDDILFVLENDGRTPTRILPVVTWAASNYINSFNIITANSTRISNDVMEFLSVSRKSLLGAFIESYNFLRDYIVSTYTPSVSEEELIRGLFNDIIKDTLIGPKKLTFGSLIESLGHQFNLAGAGVNKNALPLNFRRVGTQLPASASVLQENGGRVRWSGADELNNQYFARGLKVNGRTGRLEGRPFTSSVRRLARRAANSRTNT